MMSKSLDPDGFNLGNLGLNSTKGILQSVDGIEYRWIGLWEEKM